MKALLLSLTAACALLGFGQVTASAQEIVTTGVVQKVGDDGSLVVHSDQTQGPVTFYGVQNTNIFTVDGSPALLGDLQMGTKVTVQYAVRGGKWYVSKIMFMGAGPAVPASPAPAASAGRVGTLTGVKGP